LLLAGLIVAVVVWWLVAVRIPNGGDSWAYWAAPYSDPYGWARPYVLLPYLYSPAFLQAIAPLKLLPWDVFRGVWVAILIASVFLMTPRAAVVVLLLPPVIFELEVGNIHLLLALACVVGLRHPAAWAFVLLTKVSPGVGLLWFAVRREWRSLAVALGATMAVAAASFVLAPSAWLGWLGVFDHPSDGAGTIPVPLVVRLPLAAVLVAWGARSDRRWTVPVAATLALPLLWVNGLAMLVAVIPLIEWRRTLERFPFAGPLAGRMGPA